MKLKLFVASLMAAASFSAMAADQLVILDDNPLANNFFVSNQSPLDGVLSGGSDVITFGGLAPGLYEIVVTISGQNLSFDGVTSNLNGTAGSTYGAGKFHFFGVEHSGTSPFVLNLFGTALDGAKYSGEVTVTAVPEPATYGMLLGGLGVLGFLARRKKNNQA
ncbi:FxDxF family PEP-CTERM protein [Pseudoduganella namucuonensis]|uniref:VPLPA-CTERM protein sorting domain-containing protein n=1 Tax=Pseudoduganella namucuonensis TaxID=1035707 RepID=A0A1I7LY73_9BURK|nr:FxDxF family PEP-CTERM protein [Pseudoduganella namucuonensis]SFV14652.1 VPLPA-CTERM protein sorting domain-containing protein [Pseudoduganella namucuonensis]